MRRVHNRLATEAISRYVRNAGVTVNRTDDQPTRGYICWSEGRYEFVWVDSHNGGSGGYSLVFVLHSVYPQ